MKPYLSRKTRFLLTTLLVFILAVILLAKYSFQWHIFEHVETDYSTAALISPKDAPKLYDASWSFDGNTLIAASEEPTRRGDLYMIDLLTNHLQKLTSTQAGFYQGPVWSPTGEYIATWTNAMRPSGIWAINSQSLESFFIAEGQFVSWSRNDELVIADIVSSDSAMLATVTIVPFRGNSSKRLYEAKANYPAFTGIAWSPDGNYVAFGLDLANSLDDKSPTTLFILDKTGNVKLQISDESISSIDWTPDSKNVIYFSVVKSHISLFKVVDMNENCTEFQSSLWPIGTPNFSFDTKKIAFSGLKSEIYIADTKSIFGEGFWENGAPCQ
jgi:Tol biopolymer transport system component